ncbi:MAG: OB-fold nucleic acid binding domain-containing protein [Marmoricola sp.]|nr:OB-fold nucleic acid binding domain-containing protein [Marmoricola sp.]
MAEQKSRLRQTISRWANQDRDEARELRQDTRKAGLLCIADAPLRERVVVQGTLKTVTLRPRGGVPALEAELYDGTGSINVIWLGRRRIGGIAPGRGIRVEGRIGRQDGESIMFNPRYSLRPT